MTSAEKMELKVRDALGGLHENNPGKERFSEAEVALGAWKTDSRYNFIQPIRDKRLAVTNGIRGLLGRERKPTVAPRWFTVPGVERALWDLEQGSEPIVLKEFKHPETGEVMTDEQKQAYLNPPAINGERQPKGSLDSAQDAGYRLAHFAPATAEESLSVEAPTASQNGNGASPEDVQARAAEHHRLHDRLEDHVEY